MKKLVATLIATGMLVGMGAVLGQTTQSHDVVVTLPELVMIRLIDSEAGFGAVLNPTAVEFDFGLETADTFDPTGIKTPTNLTEANWDNVAVFSNRVGWEVDISLSGNVGSFTWSKVSVPSVFALIDGDEVASDDVRTIGWLPLGFGPADFELDLDGTELAGTYSVTVTYTITAVP